MAVTPITEINANTDATFPVSPNSPNEQTEQIRKLLDMARNRGNYRGATVYFPAGIYLIQGNVFSGFDLLSTPVFRNTKLTIRGDGPGATIFKFKQNLPASTYAFDLSGSSGTAATGFSMNNLTLNGDGKTGHWFRMNNANQILLDRVYFSFTNGYGVDGGPDWIDSNLHDCYFKNMGSASSSHAAFRAGTGSRNIRVQACRWETSPYQSCRMVGTSVSNVESIRFTCCDWDGDSAVSQAQVYAQHAKELNFRGCRFFNSGSDAIRGDNCTGMVVTGGSCDDAAGYAVNLTNSTNCIVLGNNFAGGANPTPPLNNGGNGNVTGATIYKRNAVLPTDGSQSN